MVIRIFWNSNQIFRVILSIVCRKTDKDGVISEDRCTTFKTGLKLPWLTEKLCCIIWALAAFGIGNMTQSNSISEALNSTFGLNKMIVGIVLMVLTGIVVIGGIHEIMVCAENWFRLWHYFIS